jgi:hypothetical protein
MTRRDGSSAVEQNYRDGTVMRGSGDDVWIEETSARAVAKVIAIAIAIAAAAAPVTADAAATVVPLRWDMVR